MWKKSPEDRIVRERDCESEAKMIVLDGVGCADDCVVVSQDQAVLVRQGRQDEVQDRMRNVYRPSVSVRDLGPLLVQNRVVE